MATTSNTHRPRHALSAEASSELAVLARLLADPMRLIAARGAVSLLRSGSGSGSGSGARTGADAGSGGTTALLRWALAFAGDVDSFGEAALSGWKVADATASALAWGPVPGADTAEALWAGGAPDPAPWAGPAAATESRRSSSAATSCCCRRTYVRRDTADGPSPAKACSMSATST